MDLESIHSYCLSKKGCTEGFPFGEDVLVFKVMGKMFAALLLKDPYRLNLKCDPERAIELRDSFDEVQPGWHMNKKHWNTIQPVESVPSKRLKTWIDHSYDLVAASLKKADRLALAAM